MISSTTPLKATTLSGGVLGFSGDVAPLLLAVMFNVARKLDANRPPVQYRSLDNPENKHEVKSGNCYPDKNRPYDEAFYMFLHNKLLTEG